MKRAVAYKTYLDPETGNTKVFRVTEEIKRDTNTFIKFYDAVLLEVAADQELTGKAIRLLLYIMSKLEFGKDTVYIHYDEASEELNITPRTFYNWLRVLIKKGIVEKTEKPYIYRISYSYAKKG